MRTEICSSLVPLFITVRIRRRRKWKLEAFFFVIIPKI